MAGGAGRGRPRGDPRGQRLCGWRGRAAPTPKLLPFLWPLSLLSSCDSGRLPVASPDEWLGLGLRNAGLQARGLVSIKNKAFGGDFFLFLLILPARAVGGGRAGNTKRKCRSVTSDAEAGAQSRFGLDYPGGLLLGSWCQHGRDLESSWLYPGTQTFLQMASRLY